MDLFKKILGLDEKDSDSDPKKPQTDNKNKSPFAPETDDDFKDFDNKTFGFRVFTNPAEMEKIFEKQMQEMFRMLDDEETTEEFVKLKPLMRKQMEDFPSSHIVTTDTDLDDKPEQLKALLDRISPQDGTFSTTPNKEMKRNDEEKVMDRIHDTVQVPVVVPSRPRAAVQRAPMQQQQQPQQFGVVDGAPRMFGQSIITQTIRKPDGSYVTKRMVRDSNGEVQTTITKSENGNVQTFTTHSDDKMNPSLLPAPTRDPNESNAKPIVELDRTMYLNKDGYTMPRNIF